MQNGFHKLDSIESSTQLHDTKDKDMLAFCLCYIVLLTIPSVLVDWMQMRHIRNFSKKPAVILPAKDYATSAKYSIENLRFSIINSLVDAVVFVCWVWFGLAIWQDFLVEESAFGFIVFVLGFVIINSLVHLPLDAYKQLVLDKKYGFSSVSVGIFLADTIKSIMLIGVFGFVVLWILLGVMEFAYWWLAGFGIVFCLVVLINAFYPTLIAPIFNTFTPLNDESLKTRIQDLMQKAGFCANGIFVMDASRRDGRLNAYFDGLGSSKRVVLFDTLLDKVSSDGLLTILAHELGHFKHKDIVFNLLITGIILFVLFFIAGNLPSAVFTDLGLAENHATTLVVLLLISPILYFWAMPLIGYFSRRAEYRADSYGASLTSAHCLKEALIRLVNENKTFPYAHPAYIFFHYTHPPLLKRLCALDKLDKNRANGASGANGVNGSNHAGVSQNVATS